MAELIAAARDGSAEALGHLLTFSRPYLLVIANDLLPTDLQGKGGASDLVQETQLNAARAFAGFRGHTAAELLGWLREILQNNVRDFTRRFNDAAKRRAQREISLSDPGQGPDLSERLEAREPSPSSHLQQEERVRGVEAALEHLSEEHRLVIVLHHRDGCSFDEIGRRLERSPDAVRKLWSRAVQQLKSRLRPVQD